MSARLHNESVAFYAGDTVLFDPMSEVGRHARLLAQEVQEQRRMLDAIDKALEWERTLYSASELDPPSIIAEIHAILHPGEAAPRP